MILDFGLLPERYAIAQFAPDAATPDWVPHTSFSSVTRTAGELSIICEEGAVPHGTKATRGWRCLALKGPFAFTAVGVAAEFTSVLARNGVAVLVVSTYDTDYLFVAGEELERAIGALIAGGHRVAR